MRNAGRTAAGDPVKAPAPGTEAPDRREAAGLADTLADPVAPDPADGAPDGTAPKPGTLAALAEQLGVDVAKLYDVEVPTGEGSTVKLGELKDAWRDRESVETERLAIGEEREAADAEIRRARAELAELLSAVPRDKLNPQVIEQARRTHLARMEIERQRSLSAIPAWTDDQVREADLTGIREHLAEFGLPAGALSEVQDHRMLAYMRSNLERKRRVERALGQVKTERSTGAPGRGPSSTARPTSPGSTRSGSNRTLNQRVSAIAELLSNKPGD